MIERLSKQLFIGTRRKLENVEGVSTYTSEVFNRLSATSLSLEEQLLAKCAAASAFESAAFLPQKLERKANAVAEDDNRPLCSAGAASVLGDVLKNGYFSVVIEWIEFALSRGLRPPDIYIPALLDLGISLKNYRRMILSIAGPLGKWLAEKNNAWKWIQENDTGTGYQEKTVWEEGHLSERCEFLQHLRSMDPAGAINLLREGLTGEKAANRVKLIETTRINLSERDEEFLEEFLEDKSVEVRRCSTSLLSLLPSSTLSKRMIERIEKCVVFKKKLLKKGMHIEPPEKSDASMNRDGILDKAVGGLGIRASILMTIASCTPVDWWTKTGGCSSDDILELIKKSDWTEALILGLAKAAANQGSTKWIISLLNCNLPKKIHLDRESLIRSIPFDDLDDAFSKIITPANIFEIQYLLTRKSESIVLRWSEPLSRAALTALQKAVVNYPSRWELKDIINATAQHLHSNLLEAALNSWPENHKNWEYYGDKTVDFFEIIKLRIKLYKELS